MEARKTKLPYLPDEVITEILLRSPVKSVGRFRCLSKLFSSLLSDAKFAKNQFELTIRRRSKNNRLIISSSYQKLFLVDLDSINMEREYLFKEDLNLLSKRTHIIGSSNGLICVMCKDISKDKEKVFLYNPITRDSKVILEGPKYYYSGFGFGFDALSDDYKVVKLTPCKDNEHNKHIVCYVYSLKTDSWKRINNLLPFYTYVYVSSTNLKGAIHWIASTEEHQKVLMAFDLEKDELREMPLMPNWAKEFDMDLRCFAVGTLKGCLCVVHKVFRMHNNIIWVMNEYGIENSWRKIKIDVSECSIKPLCTLNKNDEEVLLVLDGHFVYRKVDEIYMMKATSTYVESLISPNSYVDE